MQFGNYAVEISSENENHLIDYLKFNNFKYEKDLENCSEKEGYVIVINIIERIYYKIKNYLAGPILSEEDFLDKINHNKYSIHKKAYSDEGNLIYEGYTIYEQGYGEIAYGLGTSYFPNGNKCHEGVFERKGLLEGKEFYSNGQLKFEGIYGRCRGYGPHYPSFGNYYSKDGKLLFSGKFKVIFGGVGYPMIKEPKYKLIEKGRPRYILKKDEDITKLIEKNTNIENKKYPMTFEEFEEKVLELFFEYHSDEFIEILKKRLEDYEKIEPNFMKALYKHSCWVYDSPHIYGDTCKLQFEKERLRHYPVYRLRVIVGLEDGFRG